MREGAREKEGREQERSEGGSKREAREGAREK